MDIAEILIACGAAAIVVFTILYNLVRAKQGKSSCGGCAGKSDGGCMGCARQKAMQPDKTQNTVSER